MVEWKSIAELGTYFGGLTGKTKKDFENGNAHFITYMNVFSNPNLDVLSVGSVRINEGEKQNKIQKGDILFTGSSETPNESGMSCVVTEDLNEDYYMNSFCFGLRLNDYKQYDLHYFKHIFRSYAIRQEISKTASGVTRFNISKARFSKIQIPIPSKSEQERIVSILDTFTSSIANLKEQIKERRKQYEHYRDQLLDLEGKEGVEMKTLGDVCEVRKERIPATQLSKGNYVSVENLLKDKAGRIDSENFPQEGNWSKYCIGDILIGNIRPYLRKIWLADRNGGTNGDVIVIKQKTDILPKYLYYILSSEKFFVYYNQTAKGGKMPRGEKKQIFIYQSYFPSKEEQLRIVTILDQFEASIANLEAQLKEREKQYEYYRNQLLTFE